MKQAVSRGSGRPSRAVRLQFGALPYRLAEDGTIEILILTTRTTRRWIIPKGWPIKGMRPADSAAREAFEEAGVRGDTGGRAIGTFIYDKRLSEGGIVPCEVRVFPLRVRRQFKTWPEARERTLRWVGTADALKLVKVASLRRLIAAFAARQGE